MINKTATQDSERSALGSLPVNTVFAKLNLLLLKRCREYCNFAVSHLRGPLSKPELGILVVNVCVGFIWVPPQVCVCVCVVPTCVGVILTLHPQWSLDNPL